MTKELVELLAEHADALNQGDDLTSALLAQYGREFTDLAPLLWLARCLRLVLEPVKPPVIFTARLGQELVSGERWLTSGPGRQRRFVWLGAAAVGSALSLVGLVFWLARRGRLLAVPAAA